MDEEVVQGDNTVLVADDERPILTMACKMLQRAGFKTMAAADGQQAVDVFREHSAVISAVLLDISMPGLNGDEVFAELRRIDPDVKVVLTSGYQKQQAMQTFPNASALFGYIQKPYRYAELIGTFQALVAGVDS